MSKILTEIAEGILTITINRPEVLNVFDGEVHQTLDALWTRFEEDASLRVAIVTGAGDRAFSAGSDIKYYASGVPIVLPDNGYGGLSHRRVTKPIIAAVNGLALGGGFEFALCCDLLIASDDAQFGLPEAMIGAAALGGGIPRILRRMPYGVALGLLLTARRLQAADALRYGLVNEVVPREDLLDAAQAWARDIVKCAPLAIAMHKRVAEDTLFGDMSWHDLLGDSRDARSRFILDSADCAEGMRAFVEKRAPVWSGR